MSQVPDRKKLRREYLKKKRRLNTVQIVGFIILLPSILTPISIIIALILFRANFSLLYGLATIASLALWLLLVCRGWRALMEVERKERTLPYVPPFTPNTLPSNEVLVRAAQPPETPHSDVLLRAARSDETPAIELLRPTTMEDSGQ